MKKVIVALIASISIAAGAACPQLYPKSTPFDVPGVTELCSSFFVTGFDEKRKAAVFASEHLIKGTAVGSMNRNDSFRPDLRLKNGPTLSDYSGSGYDRGHLAPSDDSVNAQQMRDTFLLSNMVMQVGEFNRTPWAALELKVRNQFLNDNVDYYIVTIPVYKPDAKIVRGIPVPAGIYKIVLHGGKSESYYGENIKTSVVRQVSIDWKTLLK